MNLNLRARKEVWIGFMTNLRTENIMTLLSNHQPTQVSVNALNSLKIFYLSNKINVLRQNSENV